MNKELTPEEKAEQELADKIKPLIESIKDDEGWCHKGTLYFDRCKVRCEDCIKEDASMKNKNTPIVNHSVEANKMVSSDEDWPSISSCVDADAPYEDMNEDFKKGFDFCLSMVKHFECKAQPENNPTTASDSQIPISSKETMDAAEFKKITGFNTPAEWEAYEKGKDSYDRVLCDKIAEWDGIATNSHLFAALKKKLDELTSKSDHSVEANKMVREKKADDFRQTIYEYAMKIIPDNNLINACTLISVFAAMELYKVSGDDVTSYKEEKDLEASDNKSSSSSGDAPVNCGNSVEPLKSTELRIGNLMSNGGCVYTVDANTLYDIVNFNCQFFGISLNTEVLERLGFVKNKGGGFTLMDEDAYLFEHNGAFVYQICISANKPEWATLCEIKYVHQLQNLYYCLTGQELFNRTPNDETSVATGDAQSDTADQLNQLKKQNEGLKALLRIADCPELLIENPNLLSSPPSEKDIEWAKTAIEKYEADNQKIISSCGQVSEQEQAFYCTMCQDMAYCAENRICLNAQQPWPTQESTCCPTKVNCDDQCKPAPIVIPIDDNSVNLTSDWLQKTIEGRNTLNSITFPLAQHFGTHPEKIPIELVLQIIKAASSQPQDREPKKDVTDINVGDMAGLTGEQIPELGDLKERANEYYKKLTVKAPTKGIGSQEHNYFTYGLEWMFNQIWRASSQPNKQTLTDEEIEKMAKKYASTVEGGKYLEGTIDWANAKNDYKTGFIAGYKSKK